MNETNFAQRESDISSYSNGESREGSMTLITKVPEHLIDMSEYIISLMYIPFSWFKLKWKLVNHGVTVFKNFLDPSDD